MRNIITLALTLSSIITFAQVKKANVSYYNTLPNISIRALEVMNDSTVWFAANNGVWGYTENAGKSWKIDSIKFENKFPQFRSIAVLDANTVLLLSIESPALLYKTNDKGKHWTLVYTNTNKDIFFDCMKFKDANVGYAIADPIEGCIPIIKTTDGGNTWNEIPCNAKSKSFKNEGFFASSNSNITFVADQLYIATGGIQSRILRYTPSENKYQIIAAPLLQGEKMGGVFSINFHNKKTGVVVGGNYDKQDSLIASIAFTSNSGETWTRIKTPRPYFGACVAFKSKNKVYVTSHVGTMKCDLKKKTAIEITDQNGQALKFHTLRMSPSKKTIWMAGSGGRIAKMTKLND